MPQYIKPLIGGLNTGHALYADIQHFFEFGQLDKDIISDTALTIADAPIVDDPYIGDARQFVTASSVTDTFTVSGDTTVLVVFAGRGTRSYSGDGLAFVNLNAGDAYRLYYRGFSGGYVQAQARSDFGTSRILTTDSFASDVDFASGHAVAAHLADTETMKTCVNGVIGAATNTGTTNAWSGFTAGLLQGANALDDFSVGAIVIFNRLLSDAELQSVTSDPWALTAQANSDPVLDTPQADVTIQEGQTGTIDLGANFSDANAGDTLTYSISPAMSAGFSFNTATGVITYNGSQAVAAAKTYTVICSDGQGGSPATDSFSVTVVTASFIVDSVSDVTPDAGATFSINYSNAGAAVTASCSAGTLNKVSDNGTTAVFDVPVPPLFGDKTLNYNTAFNITFSDGTNSQAISFNVQLPAGEQFAQIATIEADGIYANDAGAAPGQYAHAKNISGDMVIDLTTGLATYNPTVNNSFDYAIYDGVWGTYASVSYTAETVKPVITLNGSASLVWVQNVAWVDPGATVTDNVDATRQITSSSAPNVSVVGSYSLAYNATDAAGNAADTVTRTVIVSSADTTPNQFTFVDVNNAELNTLYQNTQSITGVDAGQTLTATNGQLSNDNGVTWSSSCQMVTGQTLVRASITTTGTNSLEHTQLVTVNGISDTFSVTTKAAVTRTFSIGSSDPVVDSQGANLTHTYGIWQLFDKIPEDTTAVLIDSGINFTVTNGVGSVQTSAAQPSTNYIFVARDSGTSPANYIRTVGQVA